MIWRRSLFKLSTYFLSWKYRWFSCSSHSTKEILLWCYASLQSTLIIWAVNLSLISTCFHNVWVRMSAESSSRFRMSWFSWDLTSSTSNSSISRFMKVRICKNAEITENKCNWTESRAMICNWSFMTKLIIKLSFHIYILTWLKYLSWTSWLNLNTWVEHLNSTWYWFQVKSELADLTQFIKQSNMMSRELNIEIFPVFRLCIIFLHYLFDRKS